MTDSDTFLTIEVIVRDELRKERYRIASEMRRVADQRAKSYEAKLILRDMALVFEQEPKE